MTINLFRANSALAGESRTKKDKNVHSLVATHICT